MSSKGEFWQNIGSDPEPLTSCVSDTHDNYCYNVDKVAEILRFYAQGIRRRWRVRGGVRVWFSLVRGRVSGSHVQHLRHQTPYVRYPHLADAATFEVHTNAEISKQA